MVQGVDPEDPGHLQDQLDTGAAPEDPAYPCDSVVQGVAPEDHGHLQDQLDTGGAPVDPAYPWDQYGTGAISAGPACYSREEPGYPM